MAGWRRWRECSANHREMRNMERAYIHMKKKRREGKGMGH